MRDIGLQEYTCSCKCLFCFSTSRERKCPGCYWSHKWKTSCNSHWCGWTSWLDHLGILHAQYNIEVLPFLVIYVENGFGALQVHVVEICKLTLPRRGFSSSKMLSIDFGFALIDIPLRINMRMPCVPGCCVCSLSDRKKPSPVTNGWDPILVLNNVKVSLRWDAVLQCSMALFFQMDINFGWRLW